MCMALVVRKLTGLLVNKGESPLTWVLQRPKPPSSLGTCRPNAPSSLRPCKVFSSTCSKESFLAGSFTSWARNRTPYSEAPLSLTSAYPTRGVPHSLLTSKNRPTGPTSSLRNCVCSSLSTAEWESKQASQVGRLPCLHSL